MKKVFIRWCTTKVLGKCCRTLFCFLLHTLRCDARLCVFSLNLISSVFFAFVSLWHVVFLLIVTYPFCPLFRHSPPPLRPPPTPLPTWQRWWLDWEVGIPRSVLTVLHASWTHAPQTYGKYNLSFVKIQLYSLWFHGYSDAMTLSPTRIAYRLNIMHLFTRFNSLTAQLCRTHCVCCDIVVLGQLVVRSLLCRLTC